MLRVLRFPVDSRLLVKFLESQKVLHGFSAAGVSIPNPHIVQRSTVICIAANSDCCAHTVLRYLRAVVFKF